MKYLLLLLLSTSLEATEQGKSWWLDFELEPKNKPAFSIVDSDIAAVSFLSTEDFKRNKFPEFASLSMIGDFNSDGKMSGVTSFLAVRIVLTAD